MTTLELAKLVRDSGCEVDIGPSAMHNAVCVTVRNKDNFAGNKIDMAQSRFLDIEEIIDWTIKMCISKVKNTEDFKF